MAERTGLEPATPGVTGRYSDQLNYRSKMNLKIKTRKNKHKLIKNTGFNLPASDGNCQQVAERTGLEPATPGVTGRYSNQLNYRSGISTMVGAEGLEPPTLAL